MTKLNNKQSHFFIEDDIEGTNYLEKQEKRKKLKWKILGMLPVYVIWFIMLIVFIMRKDWQLLMIFIFMLIAFFGGVKWVEYCSKKEIENLEKEDFY